MKTLCPGKYHRMPRQWRNAHSHVQASLIAYCGVVQASCSTTRRQQAAYGLQEAGMSTTHHNPQLCGAPCLPACPHAAHSTADYIRADTCEKLAQIKKKVAFDSGSKISVPSISTPCFWCRFSSRSLTPNPPPTLRRQVCSVETPLVGTTRWATQFVARGVATARQIEAMWSQCTSCKGRRSIGRRSLYSSHNFCRRWWLIVKKT